MSVQQSLQTTPPESFTDPLTPPATDEKTKATCISSVISEIRRRKHGHSLSGKPWHRFVLDAHQYKDLQRHLQLDSSLWDYFVHKLRHDYFPSAKLLILRMPGLLHESLASYVTQEITLQLRAIAQSDSPSAEFAGDIDNNASAEINFTDAEYGSHQPDASFQHFNAQYPGVIIELSYSQKKKDLSRLANEYILGSDADIRVVIGIDVEYKGSKRATISMWRPQIVINDAGEGELCAIQTVTDQLFCDDVGNLVLNPEASIHLRLEDFGTEAFATTFNDLTEPIHISPETLYRFLKRSEAKATRVRQGQGLARSSKPWTRKRRRDSTPPEQLSSDREGKFADEEQRATKRATKDDASYKTSSSEAEVEAE
ncbi:Uncharacterized protein BP5553_08564 [Venustampulla echinocandica]|uniref:Uncharacterized protein n=1 Tax=Venustampulla echinocandica TaxID=2656787 RepID=A0A370TEK8_9HELO|nr:Uncharacterized protein BP5553_08564 [Venustampulla echinocandica]RDL33125.1 Uncharacterized protein BP5553_08564 [Venustampulla echinocandica]